MSDITIFHLEFLNREKCLHAILITNFIQIIHYLKEKFWPFILSIWSPIPDFCLFYDTPISQLCREYHVQLNPDSNCLFLSHYKKSCVKSQNFFMSPFHS
jgi:hypothetical protein